MGEDALDRLLAEQPGCPLNHAIRHAMILADDADDWHEWHEAYDRADSPLSRRLAVVQACIADALDAAPPGPIRVVSMCAGEGRDLLGVVASHPRRADVRGRLVELDAGLATTARSHAPDGIEVECADAGTTASYAGAVPADLVLVCGVFGNITDADMMGTIDLVPTLCAPNATVDLDPPPPPTRRDPRGARALRGERVHRGRVPRARGDDLRRRRARGSRARPARFAPTSACSTSSATTRSATTSAHNAGSATRSGAPRSRRGCARTRRPSSRS